jgi:hypothetical protein
MGCGTEFCALHVHNLHDSTLYCVLSVIVYYLLLCITYLLAVKEVCLGSFCDKF